MRESEGGAVHSAGASRESNGGGMQGTHVEGVRGRSVPTRRARTYRSRLHRVARDLAEPDHTQEGGAI